MLSILCFIEKGIDLENKCEYCGRNYITYDKNSKYCSVECYDMFRSKRQKISKKTCPVCGKYFKTYHHDQLCCSRECRGINDRRRVMCKCLKCGRHFERSISSVSGKKRVYCSFSCMIDDITKWTSSDLEILIRYYRKIKTSEISKMLSYPFSTKAINAKAIKLGISRNREWSDEEKEIVRKYYSVIPLSEILEKLPNRSMLSVRDMGRSMGLTSYSFIKKTYSKDDEKFIEDNYLSMSNEEISVCLHRTPYAIEQKIRGMNLSRPREIKKDGYKDLEAFVRARLFGWKEYIRKESNYTCCITGSKSNIVVHHCRSFNLLFAETVSVLKMPIYDSFDMYTDSQLLKFFDTFMQVQEYYHSYVCITESVHKKFHDLYGYGDNTIEQWNEFKKLYNQKQISIT